MVSKHVYVRWKSVSVQATRTSNQTRRLYKSDSIDTLTPDERNLSYVNLKTQTPLLYSSIFGYFLRFILEFLLHKKRINNPQILRSTRPNKFLEVSNLSTRHLVIEIFQFYRMAGHSSLSLLSQGFPSGLRTLNHSSP